MVIGSGKDMCPGWGWQNLHIVRLVMALRAFILGRSLAKGLGL
jgi:hypothetical protein